MSRRRASDGTPILKINAAEMPTMPAHCKTCPFAPNGDKQLMSKVIDRTMFQASQICHGSEGPRRQPRFLCKGARDLTVQVLHGMGILAEATDECFRAESKRRLEGSDERC